MTHEKSIVVDEKAALVATFNLCDKYFTLTRDYGIITDDPVHVAQIVEVFNADWEHRDWDCSAYEGLLWSNSNSRYHMAQFIDTANDATRHPAPEVRRRGHPRTHRRGGRPRREGARAVRRQARHQRVGHPRHLRLAAHAARFGVKVHKQKNLRVHAKLIVVDDEQALVGSMNIDRSAFDLRRELGIMIRRPGHRRPG